MDIQESLLFLRFLCQFGNLSQWRIIDLKKWTMKRSNLLIAYTLVVILISFAMLTYGFFTDFHRTTGNDIGEMANFIQIVGIRLAHLVSIAESLFHSREEMRFFTAVREIDHIFDCSLNVDVNNRLFKRRAIQNGVVMLTIYIGSQTFIILAILIVTDKSFSIFWILYMLPFLICGLRYFQIFNAILIIKNRFDKLTNVLSHVNLDYKTSKLNIEDTENIKFISKELPIFGSMDRFKRRIEMENPEMKRLLTIRDVYNRLWELHCIVNNCFGISMLISVANDFISVTSNGYWVFLNFKKYSSTLLDVLQIASSAAWSIPHVFNMLVLAIICERTVKSSASIALGLHSIKIDYLNDNHNTLIEQFSMQLLHQKLAFTAAGFFHVDCTLLYTIIGATTTYLIILIQFHMNEQKTSV